VIVRSFGKAIAGLLFLLLVGSAAVLSLHYGCQANALSWASGLTVIKVGVARLFGLELITIPQTVDILAGSFAMGSYADDGWGERNEKPQHTVTINRTFRLGKYEVTFAEYDLYSRTQGKPMLTDDNLALGKQPVVNVSWHDAIGYARWLSLVTGRNFRLPSEAEWEYAARARTTATFWWGGTVGQNHANCIDCGNGEGIGKRPLAVGTLGENAFGLADMAGNVMEWVQDCYAESYSGAPSNGNARNDQSPCPLRVLRGGSWADGKWSVRSAFRMGDVPEAANYTIGFRLAEDFDAEPQKSSSSH
jgi:formylglycine-generating enzyme required for sulfatase activity